MGFGSRSRRPRSFGNLDDMSASFGAARQRRKSKTARDDPLPGFLIGLQPAPFRWGPSHKRVQESGRLSMIYLMACLTDDARSTRCGAVHFLGHAAKRVRPREEVEFLSPRAFKPTAPARMDYSDRRAMSMRRVGVSRDRPPRRPRHQLEVCGYAAWGSRTATSNYIER